VLSSIVAITIFISSGFKKTIQEARF